MEFTTTEWNGKKVIIGMGELDPSRPIKLLIGFHGADSTPENMLVQGSGLQLENGIQVFPEGPVDAGEGLWSWWLDGPKQKESVIEFLDYSHRVIETGQEFLANQIAEAMVETCLWGFSQGAAASLVYSLHGRHPVHQVASVCGFLPEMPEVREAPPAKSRILGIYGVNDDVVPSFLADFALDEMKNQGHELTVNETQQGHEISPENLRQISDFFKS